MASSNNDSGKAVCESRIMTFCEAVMREDRERGEGEGGREEREGWREGDRERKRGKTRFCVLQHGAKLSRIQTPNLHTAPARAGDARTIHAMRVMSAGEGLARARPGGHRRGPRRASPAPCAPAHNRRARAGAPEASGKELFGGTETDRECAYFRKQISSHPVDRYRTHTYLRIWRCQRSWFPLMKFA